MGREIKIILTFIYSIMGLILAIRLLYELPALLWPFIVLDVIGAGILAAYFGSH